MSLDSISFRQLSKYQDYHHGSFVQIPTNIFITLSRKTVILSIGICANDTLLHLIWHDIHMKSHRTETNLESISRELFFVLKMVRNEFWQTIKFMISWKIPKGFVIFQNRYSTSIKWNIDTACISPSNNHRSSTRVHKLIENDAKFKLRDDWK